jgi:hypothetical protein
MASRGGASKYGLVNALPLRDIQGTTITLGTADASVGIPTDPRPHGVILEPILSAEDYMRIRIDTSSETDGGYLADGNVYQFPTHSASSSIHASVATSDGTLYLSWVFAGSV